MHPNGKMQRQALDATLQFRIRRTLAVADLGRRRVITPAIFIGPVGNALRLDWPKLNAELSALATANN